MQKQCFDEILGNKNLLISSPTGSGKTLLTYISVLSTGKTIYIAPMKAIINDLKKSFVGLNISEATGDNFDKKFENSDVVFFTPEKFLSFFSKYSNRIKLKKYKLVIFDEIQILNSERGYVIENIKILLEEYQMRTICMSATISNKETISKYFNSEVLEFNKLRTHTLIKDIIKNVIDENILLDIVKDSFINNKILIFVEKRLETIKILKCIINNLFGECIVSENQILNILSEKMLIKEGLKPKIEDYFLDKPLKIAKIEEIMTKNFFIDFIIIFGEQKGIFIHHAGLKKAKRFLVENSDYKIIISTRTLAWGVNLNPDFVIIKDKFETLDTIQMMGRTARIKAGRVLYSEENLGEDFNNFQSHLSKYFKDFLIYQIYNLLPNKEKKRTNFFESENIKIQEILFFEGKKSYLYNEKKLIKYLKNQYKKTFSYLCNDNLFEKIKDYLKILEPIFLIKKENKFLITSFCIIAAKSYIRTDDIIKLFNLVSIEHDILSLLNNFQDSYLLINLKKEIMTTDNNYILKYFTKNRKNLEENCIKSIKNLLNLIEKISVYKRNGIFLKNLYFFYNKNFSSKILEYRLFFEIFEDKITIKNENNQKIRILILKENWELTKYLYKTKSFVIKLKDFGNYNKIYKIKKNFIEKECFVVYFFDENYFLNRKLQLFLK